MYDKEKIQQLNKTKIKRNIERNEEKNADIGV